ncbi:hypothetical protein H1R20_g9252, partial [Candolleomyces eurysporus]
MHRSHSRHMACLEDSMFNHGINGIHKFKPNNPPKLPMLSIRHPPENGSAPLPLDGDTGAIGQLRWDRAERYRVLNPSLREPLNITLLDRNIQLATEGAHDLLEDLVDSLGLQGLSWEKVIGAFYNCGMLFADRDSEEEIERDDNLPTVTPPRWKHPFRQGRLDSVNASMVNRAHGWLMKFMTDGGVQTDLGFDVEDLIRRLVQLPYALDEGLKRRETTFLCVNVLRYLDPEHPYIQVSRLRLFVWARFNGTKIYPVDWGIKGTYNSLKYRPRDKMLRNIAIQPRFIEWTTYQLFLCMGMSSIRLSLVLIIY